MNEQAKEVIAKVLEYLEATEGFAVEQAPLLAQEIVRWGVWSNGAMAAGCLILSTVAYFTAKLSWKKIVLLEDNSRAFCERDGFSLLLGIASGLCIISCMIFPFFLNAALKALIPTSPQSAPGCRAGAR